MSRRRKSTDTTPFDTVRLEGSLFVPELLERAASGNATAQKEADYAIPKGLKLHDEYGRAFRIATANWQAFTPQTARADLDAATVTRSFVIDLLRQCLGYTDLTPLSSPIQLGDRGFPVTAQALGGRLPVIIAPHNLGLDDPDPRFAIVGSGSKKKSAHQLAQEFLNASPDCLWSIVTNGKALRLLRDADTLTRPNFLEFDLETILRDDQHRYADFSALWRILHASRAGESAAASADCIWEKWKTEGHAQGLRVRDGLRGGVTQALLILGRGFLTYTDKDKTNDPLRQRLHDGTLTKEAYFQQLLRLIYRNLFLFCAEERDLLHAPDATPAARQAYATGYSLRRLRSRALRQSAHDPHGDLWQSLRIVFRGLSSGEPRLALPALGGLFAETQCPDLDNAAVTNRDLLSAMRELRWFFDRKSGKRSAVDYRNMGPEELGSVYESLLELVPQLDLSAREFTFAGLDQSGGNARKTSGSYYTPDSLVQELIKSALDPVISDRVASQPDRPIDALLSISVCDPACGSGHFLLAAARRLAEKLAELRAPDGAVKPDDYRHALREVIARCIHGVDRNPLALELARTVLWLEGVDPGLPLSFLDHHLVCGDALLGLTDLRQLQKGVPDDAFTALSGDDKKLCTELKKQNKAARKQLDDLRKGQDLDLTSGQTDTLAEFANLEAMLDSTPEEIAAKESAWRSFLSHARDSPIARAADIFVGAFLTTKSADANPPDTRTLMAALFPAKSTPELAAQISAARIACDQEHANVLHWPLAFPKVFARGGFDCILGNPPWERIKLQEEEFFATREPLIAAAKNKAERAKRIQWLSEGSLGQHLHHGAIPDGCNPAETRLYQEFITTRRTAEATSVFAHVDGREGGRYPLTGVGDVNTYALFSETISNLTSPTGRAGFIVPMGIATDDTTKAFFAHQISQRRLAQLIALFEIRAWFPATDDRKAFCLLTLGTADKTRFIFEVKTIADLQQAEKWIELPADDLLLINPNTRTCPIFRSCADAELTRSIYRRVPVLFREARDDQPESNPWGVRFMAMIHMANDSGLFSNQPGTDLLPLYEAKMVHQFDHRWSGYSARDGEDGASDLSPAEKQDPACAATPRYWLPQREVLARLADVPRSLTKAWLADDEEAATISLQHWVIASLHPDSFIHGEASLFAPDPAEELKGFALWDAVSVNWRIDPKLMGEMRNASPLTRAELFELRSTSQLTSVLLHLHNVRSPRWLIGWRDICRATDERTVIAAVLPRAGTGDTLLLMFSSAPTHLVPCLLAEQDSLVHDFVARQKVGGTHLKYHVKKQLPNLPPGSYTEADLAYIVPRVLALTYTTHDLRPWAEDVIVSYQRQFPQHPPLVPDPGNPEPFPFDPDRRAQVRAELDARYARLYGLTRDELRYILDPADTHGSDYPSETFRVLKNNEQKQFGEYRTGRLVLEAWDRDSENQTGSPTWQDEAFHLLAPDRKPLTDYRILVWPELLRQMPGDIDFEIFRKAYWLLSEPGELAKVGPPILPDLPAAWWQARTEHLEKSDFLPSLKGSALLHHVRIWCEDGVRYIRWTGPTDANPFPEAVDDARVALQVAELWPDEMPAVERAAIEPELIALESL